MYGDEMFRLSHAELLNLALALRMLGKVALVTGLGPGIALMGLYNFQRRFVPKIRSGEKMHTIRAVRAHPDKPGNTLHLYTGLRTKKAKLLMRVPCVKVEEITIWNLRRIGVMVEIDGELLRSDEKEALAQRDGFANFEEMIEFWSGRLPFSGHIIHWRKAA
jgi:hypothetical protein